jgi:hypothetical protein
MQKDRLDDHRDDQSPSDTESDAKASTVVALFICRSLALPAAHVLARYYPATGPAALALLSLVLLLTPTGSLPSPRWRWWAFLTAATPVALLVVAPLVPGRFDPQLLLASSPFSDRALAASCWSPPGSPWPSPPWPWPSPPHRCWCASAAPTGSNASSCAGWR